MSRIREANPRRLRLLVPRANEKREKSVVFGSMLLVEERGTRRIRDVPIVNTSICESYFNSEDAAMAQFKSAYAEALLRAHQPSQYAYFLSEVDLSQDAAGASLADEAYAEMLQLGYVEQSATAFVMPYSGALPRKAFKLTDAGLQVRPADPIAPDPASM